jgi:uncharacterized glyoxalase superfamily protein PhnB
MNEETAVRFSGVAPYLYYEDAGEALEWLARVFGFRERVRYVDEDGSVKVAEMNVGDTTIHVDGAGAGYWERNGTTGPVGHLAIVHVDDVEAHHAHATAAGHPRRPARGQAVWRPCVQRDRSRRPFLELLAAPEL